MKHRSVGGAFPMRLVSGVPRGAQALTNRAQPELSREARQRLKWFDHYQRHGNVSLTCQYPVSAARPSIGGSGDSVPTPSRRSRTAPASPGIAADTLRPRRRCAPNDGNRQTQQEDSQRWLLKAPGQSLLQSILLERFSPDLAPSRAVPVRPRRLARLSTRRPD